MSTNPTAVRADFNGLFGDLLCLSHGEACVTANGDAVQLSEGLELVAFEDDSLEGKQEYLVATGSVEPAPPELACNGSRWVLHIDTRGVRHETEIPGRT
jgi:hypothetical protein